MVKINEDAFAAVTAAFPDAVQEPKQSAPTTTTPSASRKGVGAGTSVSNVANVDIDRRVLQIGSKKRKQSSLDEADIEEEEHQREEDDDEEEDLGRTAIAKSSNNLRDATSVENALTKKKKTKKKKKNKKKKMEQEAAAQTDEAKTEAKTTIEQSAGAPAKDVICGVDSSNDEQKIKSEQNDSSGNKKKRTKRRSRQKNIRKDNRVKKPDYLNPDSKDYKGRPLTAETRRRLKMPESHRVQKLKSFWLNEERKTQDKEDAP